MPWRHQKRLKKLHAGTYPDWDAVPRSGDRKPQHKAPQNHLWRVGSTGPIRSEGGWAVG